MFSIEDIKLDLYKNLSSKRYEHSIRVALEAKKLARHYGVNEENAYLAGLLHDIAKEYDNEENEKWVNKYALPEYLLEISNSKICHAVIGAIVAKELYQVNEEIVNAISYHTIGNVNMSLLDKIVFIADKIESGKDHLGIEEERKLAYKDIDLAMIRCIENSSIKLKNEGKSLNMETVRLLNSLKSKVLNCS